jgi:O-antigen ligase
MRFIKLGLYAVLLTPLCVWPELLVPQLTPKIIAFQVLIEIVCASVLICILVQEPRGWKQLHVLRSPLLLALAAFLAYSLLSAFAGEDFQRSLWGIIDRQDGLVLLLHFLAWTACLAWFHSPSSGAQACFRTYLNFSFWVSVAAAMTGAWEWWSLTSTGTIPAMLRSTSTPGRLSGVFGSPMTIGPYLTFHFFYGLYYAWRSAMHRVRTGDKSRGTLERRGLGPRIAKAGLILGAEGLLGAITFGGQSRGVIFGFLAGLLILATMFVFSRFTGWFVKAGGAALILLTLVGAASVWHFRESRFVIQNVILNRLTRISLTDDVTQTVRPRLMIWRSALQGFWEHPLLGCGHNNIYLALNKHYNPKLAEHIDDFTMSRVTWYDKSHNAYIDLLVEKGVLGAILYLVVVGAVSIALWRMEDRILGYCLAAGLVAYAVSNFVSFDSFGPLFGLFLFMAAIIEGTKERGEPKIKVTAMALTRTSRSQKGSRGAAQRAPTPEDALRFVVCGTIVALLALGIYVNLEIAGAAKGYCKAKQAIVANQTNPILLYKDAFKRFSPYAAGQKLECAYAAVSNLVEQEKASHGREVVELAAQLAAGAVTAHPKDARTYMMLNDMYNALALYIDPKFATYAEAAGKKALELSPMRQEMIFLLARTYLIAKQPQAAVELNRKAVEAYPDFKFAHWYLGLALAADNHREEAKKEISRAIQLGYKPQNADEEGIVSQLSGDSKN